MNKLLVVGGGTAGHVIPALPVIEHCLAAGWQATFVGTHSGLEEGLVKHLPIEFRAIQSGKLRRYWSWQNVTDVLRVLVAILQALGLMLRNRPDVVFSKGGFVSFPVVFAAWLLRIPVVAHESDLSPGLANRLCAPFIRTLCVSFAATVAAVANPKRVVHTGTPVRQELLQGDAARGREALGLTEDGPPLLVITGGSLGAENLNRVVLDAAPELAQDFRVFHVCGAGKTSDVSIPGYEQVEYVGAGWGDILAAADVVVSRAGANALFELLALRKLNLLVPLTAQVSRGDQLENAEFARAAGLSLVVQEADLTVQSLQQALAELRSQAPTMRTALEGFETPDAARAIADELFTITAT